MRTCLVLAALLLLGPLAICQESPVPPKVDFEAKTGVRPDKLRLEGPESITVHRGDPVKPTPPIPLRPVEGFLDRLDRALKAIEDMAQAKADAEKAFTQGCLVGAVGAAATCVILFGLMYVATRTGR